MSNYRKIWVLVLLLVLTACAAAPRKSTELSDLSRYPLADMSGFATLAHADDLRFHDVSVADVSEMMDSDESFVLICAYPGCPWCELLVGPLNDAAKRAGCEMAFINTRRDPSWQSNLDMDDYDIFVELFGEYLDEDEAGIPHLYVPDLYFVRDGEVVVHRPGVLAGHDDPAVPLSEEETAHLASELDACFQQL